MVRAIQKYLHWNLTMLLMTGIVKSSRFVVSAKYQRKSLPCFVLNTQLNSIAVTVTLFVPQGQVSLYRSLFFSSSFLSMIIWSNSPSKTSSNSRSTSSMFICSSSLSGTSWSLVWSILRSFLMISLSFLSFSSSSCFILFLLVSISIYFRLVVFSILSCSILKLYFL